MRIPVPHSATEFPHFSARTALVCRYGLPPWPTREASALRKTRNQFNQFGYPTDTVITPDHFLGPVLPIGRKMTLPTSLSILDKNGTRHECVAEAFDTTYNILILLYPVRALSAKTIIMTHWRRLPTD